MCYVATLLWPIPRGHASKHLNDRRSLVHARAGIIPLGEVGTASHVASIHGMRPSTFAQTHGVPKL